MDRIPCWIKISSIFEYKENEIKLIFNWEKNREKFIGDYGTWTHDFQNANLTLYHWVKPPLLYTVAKNVSEHESYCRSWVYNIALHPPNPTSHCALNTEPERRFKAHNVNGKNWFLQFIYNEMNETKRVTTRQWTIMEYNAMHMIWIQIFIRFVRNVNSHMSGMISPFAGTYHNMSRTYSKCPYKLIASKTKRALLSGSTHSDSRFMNANASRQMKINDWKLINFVTFVTIWSRNYLHKAEKIRMEPCAAEWRCIKNEYVNDGYVSLESV